MARRTGQCLCGAVHYEAEIADRFAACYCKMCQRWSSGAFMGVTAAEFEITKGADDLTVFESSDWAVRAFCSKCGSNIYYHAVNYGGPSVAIGTLDDNSSLQIHTQYFIDRKPEGFFDRRRHHDKNERRD